MNSVISRARRVRTYLLAAYDFLAWALSFLAMAALQYAVGYSNAADIAPALVLGIACGLVFVSFGVPMHLHSGRSPIGSFPDAVLTSVLGGTVAFLALVTNFAIGAPVRISVAVTAPMCAFVLILGSRAAYRMFREWMYGRGPGRRTDRQPVVVIGAGDGGAQLVSAMFRDVSCPWLPVALVDDDPYKRHRRLNGVPVAGDARDFVDVAAEYGARTVIMAVPSATAGLVREFNRLANRAGIELKVVPSVNNLSNPAHVQIEDVRDIDVTDFLGRQPIETDLAAIAGYLTGRRVMVTGAGGSIGSELCRQIAKFGPSELIMMDRDESALHAVQLSMHGRALLDSEDTELGDIRDPRYVRELFQRRHPHVVFHAAALKHLPLLEAAPGEAVKTNVWGTQAVLEAAIDSGVEHFVNISTDKAANPCSALGYSKRLAEGLTSAAARQAEGSFMSVRFGNVLGSRGSVLTTFTAQIARGGPVTVTDPRVTRYFMTIREAVQLVIQAGALGSNGDVLVLDMGEPIAIKAVAEQLIDLAGTPVEIVYTGLRDGEKLHEELFGHGEGDLRPIHPLISHVLVPRYQVRSGARRLDPYAEPLVIIRAMAEACAGMQSALRSVDLLSETDSPDRGDQEHQPARRHVR